MSTVSELYKWLILERQYLDSIWRRVSNSCRSIRKAAHQPRMRGIRHGKPTYLKHEADNQHHSNTGYNICMVLNDELMTENRRTLTTLSTPRNSHLTRL
jgi:hypothetical protein